MFPSLFSLPYLFPFGIVSISFTAEGSDVLAGGKRDVSWFPLLLAALKVCKNYFLLKLGVKGS